jgi:hypothetical protein
MISKFKLVVEIQLFQNSNDFPVYSPVRFNNDKGLWEHGFHWNLVDANDLRFLRLKNKERVYK